jgi:hypothetical protein
MDRSANSSIPLEIILPWSRPELAPRFRVDKQAVAEYGGDKYPCVVRDISSSGAAIEFPDFLGV